VIATTGGGPTAMAVEARRPAASGSALGRLTTGGSAVGWMDSGNASAPSGAQGRVVVARGEVGIDRRIVLIGVDVISALSTSGFSRCDLAASSFTVVALGCHRTAIKALPLVRPLGTIEL